MEITIKNMVCPRCISSVQSIFKSHQIPTSQVELGRVVTEHDVTATEKDKLKQELSNAGFEWIDDHKTALIEKIKTLIIEAIHHGSMPRLSWSEFLSSELPYDYKYISHLFSEIHGITIEQYILRQKIEKVKELIRYDQLTLSQIAYHLQYSSVAHLSAQFKKITGMTPSEFKTGQSGRQSIDVI